MFQFTRIGLIILERDMQKNEDDILTIALEIDVNDVVFFDDSIEVYTHIHELTRTKEFFEHAGLIVNSAEIIYRPQLPLSVSDEVMDRIDILVTALHDLDDVQKVHTNIL